MENALHLADAKECAAFLRVSRSHLDALVRAGLPFHDATLPGRQRRRLRFDLSEVLEWMRARARSAA
jgi:predicted DNA-binding transcriptional regulator AlpA